MKSPQWCTVGPKKIEEDKGVIFGILSKFDVIKMQIVPMLNQCIKLFFLI